MPEQRFSNEPPERKPACGTGQSVVGHERDAAWLQASSKEANDTFPHRVGDPGPETMDRDDIELRQGLQVPAVEFSKVCLKELHITQSGTGGERAGRDDLSGVVIEAHYLPVRAARSQDAGRVAGGAANLG